MKAVPGLAVILSGCGGDEPAAPVPQELEVRLSMPQQMTGARTTEGGLARVTCEFQITAQGVGPEGQIAMWEDGVTDWTFANGAAHQTEWTRNELILLFNSNGVGPGGSISGRISASAPGGSFTATYRFRYRVFSSPHPQGLLRTASASLSCR